MDIKLAKPKIKGIKSLEECIYKRKSTRDFSEKVIEEEKISQLLWSAQGKSYHKRTAPSAGATYPLEIFVVLKDKGLFYYNSKENILEHKFGGKIGDNLAYASYRQIFIEKAPLNIIICADFSRTCNRYGDRGSRYVFIEVGHCAQNIHLECISLGLVSVPIGAFKDEKVKELLKLPKNIDPLYIIPIGYSK